MNTADLEWRKSSRSDDSASGACVEVAFVPSAVAVAVRDSKNVSGPVLAFPTLSWDAFRADLRTNQA